MSGADDDFLSRWSRRKRLVADDEQRARTADDVAEPVSATSPAQSTAPDPEADRLLLNELGLKDPDDLRPGEEIAAFLKAAIPNHLKQRALRRLWGSNPVLANLDGLNDYDGDFTGGGVGPGELKTAYQVGKGFVRDLLVEKPLSDPAEADILSVTQSTAEGEMPDPLLDAGPVVEGSGSDDPPEPRDASIQRGKRRIAFRFDREE